MFFIKAKHTMMKIFVCNEIGNIIYLIFNSEQESLIFGKLKLFELAAFFVGGVIHLLPISRYFQNGFSDQLTQASLTNSDIFLFGGLYSTPTIVPCRALKRNTPLVWCLWYGTFQQIKKKP